MQNGTALRTVDVTTGEGPRLAVLVGGGTLQIYDVSDPAKPVSVIAIQDARRAQRVALHGRLAYVADGAGGLRCVDLSKPAPADGPRVAHDRRPPRATWPWQIRWSSSRSPAATPFCCARAENRNADLRIQRASRRQRVRPYRRSRKGGAIARSVSRKLKIKMT